MISLETGLGNATGRLGAPGRPVSASLSPPLFKAPFLVLFLILTVMSLAH